MADVADAALLSRVEDASLNASAALQQRWLDGWILRYGPGQARRSRCINAVAAGRLPLAQNIERAAAVYRAAGLPMVFRVTRFSEPADLDARLQALGWAATATTLVLVKHLNQQAAADLPPDLPAGLHWDEPSAAAFADAVGALRGTPDPDRAAHAQRLAAAPVPHAGYAIRQAAGGAVIACGQAVQEADLVGLYDVHTAPANRGLGLASLLCERLLTRAAAHGAMTAYLQVESDNDPALRVYRRLGFVDGYSYHYRLAPGA